MEHLFKGKEGVQRTLANLTRSIGVRIPKSFTEMFSLSPGMPVLIEPMKDDEGVFVGFRLWIDRSGEEG